MVGKCSLQVLSISYNIIGDDGITAIAGALNSSQISELHIVGCGITIIGARSLAAGLLVNNSIRILLISNNPITMEGARLILQSAVYSESCQEVLMDDEHHDDEVKMLITTLAQKKR